MSHNAAGRRADRAKIGAEKRLLAVAIVPVAKPEQTMVATQLVPARRLPRADWHQERHADATAIGVCGGPAETQHVVSAGRTERRPVPEPVQIAGRRHQENGTRVGLVSAGQRRRV